MSPNKRKIFVSDSSDEDDSFKHRRSSLRVNLSYTENLTDSGNGSLTRTKIENNERRAARTIKEISRGKSFYEKNRRSSFDSKTESNTNERADNNSELSVQIKEGIQLKRLTINLEDISTKEHLLETSCKRLKDAIICKTKQLFDKENELSIKITKVLGDNENDLASSTHNPNIENKKVLLDGTDYHLKKQTPEKDEQHIDTLSNQCRKGQFSNIVTTPITSDRQRNLESTIDKSRLTQKRLFVGNRQVEEQMKCRIIEDVILKKNQPLISLPKQLNESGSPILSGSNRRLSLGRARSKLHSQNLNNSYSTIHSTQTTSDIGIPVGCSTFIDDAMSEKEIDDVDTSRATCTTNNVVSMEMTEIYGGICMSSKHASLRNRNSNMIKCNKNDTKMKSKEESMERNRNAVSSKLKDVEHSKNKVTVQNDIHSNLFCTDDANDQDKESVYMDTAVPMQVSIEQVAVVTKTHDVLQLRKSDSKAKYQNDRCHMVSLSDSNDTIRSSLNVNTSLDGMTEANKTRNIWKPSNHGIHDANQDFEAISNKKLNISNERYLRESVNTVRTSLQVNTSVDSMHKTWQERSNKDGNHSCMDMEYTSTTENKETIDVDSLENMSLIDRLRNISVRNQISYNDKSRVSKIRDEDKRRSSNSGDSCGYVEATPYPISRSILFRSQLKSKTQHLDDAATCSSNLNSIDNEENNDKTRAIALHSKVSNETHGLNKGTGTQETIADTVTLEDTSSCNPFVTQNQLTVMEDKINRTKSETDGKNIAVQNIEQVLVRKGRRKLLPLNETSQLCSLTPIEDKKITPEESFVKRNKRLKKKLPKRKLMHPKANTSSIKCDTASKQMSSDSSDSDIFIFENKKKEKNKKTRKPKKVISKKIVIKKFADENVLNMLQENKQNEEDHPAQSRDSFDDFVECRTISTQWNKYKSQKIVIVTTGLSKGDESLVKSIVKSLGKAEMELNVSKRTTHVVSSGVRTVNLLRGIIRGCWLVPLEWILKSLENNKWLDPEAFEMKHFSKAVQENRKDRQLFGFSYIPELFTTCGFIHVEHQTTMPCATLKELIKTAGGHITENMKLAKIIIGANGLKETWVIDSITTGELQLTKLYQRN